MKLKLASLTLLSVALIATACSNNDNSTTQSSRTIENSKKVQLLKKEVLLLQTKYNQALIKLS
nr:hypothetical protein [Lactobacillus acidophilus]